MSSANYVDYGQSFLVCSVREVSSHLFLIKKEKNVKPHHKEKPTQTLSAFLPMT